MPLYLDLDGLTGDSTTASYAGAFLALTYSWGEELTLSGNTVGKSVPGQLILTRNTAKGSPLLFYVCATGTAISAANFFQTDVNNGDEKVFLEFKLTNVFITSYSLSGEADVNPTETFALSFDSLTYIQYYLGGSQSESHTFGTP